MAFKLRRRAEMITNENLPNRNSRRNRNPLGTGAVSFKRVLGGGSLEHVSGDESFRLCDVPELEEAQPHTSSIR
jgi:hypothetical protein